MVDSHRLEHGKLDYMLEQKSDEATSVGIGSTYDVTVV